MTTASLQDLRDIHLPTAISWWPLAWGWYILLIVLVGLIGFAWYCWQQKQRQKRIFLSAVNKLHQLRIHFHQHPNHNPIVELSELCRRVAIAYFPRREVGGLTGEKWLAFLDQTGHTKAFSQGAGQQLSTGPYSEQPVKEAEQLFALIEQWLKQLQMDHDQKH